MTELYFKNRKKDIDYKAIIKKFLNENNKIAFIPDDQKDTNRFNWHSAAEELNIGHKTLKLWKTITLCGQHDRPIIGVKPGREEYGYDSDYECDYECGSDEDCYSNCCHRDESRLCKMRTVVIFNKEGMEKIKYMRVEDIKDLLVKEGIVNIINNKYTI